MISRLALFAVFVSLCGCVRYPEPYRPPVQRRPLEIGPSARLKSFVSMSAPDAAEHLVRDVLPDLKDGTWRWVMQRPTFQFHVPTTKGLKLRVDLTVPDVTFKDTGPVKINVFVGEHELDTLEFKEFGQRLWEKDVPEEWLTAYDPVIVRLEIDKLWTAKEDGVQRGFIITKLGFVE